MKINTDRVLEAIIFVWIAVLLACMASCRSTKLEEQREYTKALRETMESRLTMKESTIDSLVHVILMRDSMEHVREEKDSTYRTHFVSDTLMVKDSVYTHEYADGSTLTERWHYETRIVTQHDTLLVTNKVYDYKEEYNIVCEQMEQLSRYTYAQNDTLKMLRDSIDAMTKTVTKTVTKTPWYENLLWPILAALVLLGAVQWWRSRK